MLRPKKALGLTALTLTFAALAAGGPDVAPRATPGLPFTVAGHDAGGVLAAGGAAGGDPAPARGRAGAGHRAGGRPRAVLDPSRLHVIDVLATRGLVLVPVFLLGFETRALYAYLVLVSFHAVFIHANGGWPEAYGTHGDRVPEGWWAQLRHPFRR